MPERRNRPDMDRRIKGEMTGNGPASRVRLSAGGRARRYRGRVLAAHRLGHGAGGPPERDLWDLDPGDGSVLAAYARATGIVARPPLPDLYRLRWDIAEIAIDVSRFRRPHTGTAEDDEAWELLSPLIERVSRGEPGR